jgi:hypothetical protein
MNERIGMDTQLEKMKGQHYRGLAKLFCVDGHVILAVAADNNALAHLWEKLGMNEKLNLDQHKKVIVVSPGELPQ